MSLDVGCHYAAGPARDFQPLGGPGNKPAVDMGQAVAHAFQGVKGRARLALQQVEGRILRHECEILEQGHLRVGQPIVDRHEPVVVPATSRG